MGRFLKAGKNRQAKEATAHPLQLVNCFQHPRSPVEKNRAD
jgi:hypothetical protein